MRRVWLWIIIFEAIAGTMWAQGPGRGQARGGAAPQPSGAPGGFEGPAVQAVQAATRQAVPVDPKKLCKLEGRTVNARTGEPVPRVTLTLAGAGQGGASLSTRSGNDGAFLIENVPPGSYRLIAERVGFLRQGYGSRTPGGAGAPLNLSEAQHLRDLEFRLTPQGVILGVVLDEEGDPLPRASVSAYPVGGAVQAFGAGGGMRPGMPAGQAPASTGITALANDIGEFRLAGLSPGRYYVVATSQGQMGGRGMAGRGGAAGQADEAGLAPLPTYFPSTLDAGSGVPVEIAPGQDVAGINITIRKGQLFRITGRLMGGSAQEMTAVALSLMPRGEAAGLRGGAGARVNQDGSFEITRVRPGSYFLLAQRMNRAGSGLAAKLPVDVSASDINGLVVPFTEPVTLAGTVKTDSQQSGAAAPLRPVVTLTSVDGLPVGSPAARAGDGGAFKIDAVFPDRYYLNVTGLPEGSYVKSVRIGGQEVADKGIDLAGAHGSVAMEVTVSANGASLEGAVTIDGKPGTGAYVAVLTDPVRPEAVFRNKFVTADQDGRFTIRGLAPGAYSVYAFDQPMPQLSRAPGLVRPYERDAVKVRLSENSTERVELKAISSAESQ
jgi:hypothetical protein